MNWVNTPDAETLQEAREWFGVYPFEPLSEARQTFTEPEHSHLWVNPCGVRICDALDIRGGAK